MNPSNIYKRCITHMSILSTSYHSLDILYIHSLCSYISTTCTLQKWNPNTLILLKTSFLVKDIGVCNTHDKQPTTNIIMFSPGLLMHVKVGIVSWERVGPFTGWRTGSHIDYELPYLLILLRCCICGD